MVNKQNEPICWSSMDFKMTSRRLEKQSQKLIFNQFVLISWVEQSDNSALLMLMTSLSQTQREYLRKT